MNNPTPNILDANIHGTMMFRLLFRTQDDRYEPETARAIVEGLKGVDDETFAVGMKVWAMEAERKVTVN